MSASKATPRSLLALTLLLSATGWAGCLSLIGDDDDPSRYPRDDQLRLNHMQVKGTHNSYHVSTASSLPEWRYDHLPLDVQLREHDVRQIELDVHFAGDGVFDVFHVPVVDEGSTCATLRACLQLARAWSDEHREHPLLFFLVEPKDDIDRKKIVGHYDELDKAVLDVWPRDRLLRPDDVRGKYTTLRAALEAYGWPTLARARGKAMFIMLDSGVHRSNYLADAPTLEGRVMFARGGSDEPWAAIAEIANATARAAEIHAAVDAGFLVRSSADDPTASAAANAASSAAALASGAHLISTDFPAKLASPAYWLDLAARCNPRSAPASCRDRDIER